LALKGQRWSQQFVIDLYSTNEARIIKYLKGLL